MIEPARATFLLIDMQNGFIDGASPLCIAGAAATVPTCARALEAAREPTASPVYHVRRTYAADGSDVEAARWKAWAEGGPTALPRRPDKPGRARLSWRRPLASPSS